MSIKAILLDFYGTLVHEDDEVIPVICEKIKVNSPLDCNIKDIGKYWWQVFSKMFQSSYGDSFKTQRELEVASLSKTITYFKSDCNADEIIQEQFDHWVKPKLYNDTVPFLQQFNTLPVLILSNIDTSDIILATRFHNIQVNDVITSEDVRAYKPRPELFLEGLSRYKLNANEVIHIGDSITSDVLGANKLGIKTIWLNRLNKQKPGEIKPDYICKDLKEAQTILLRELGEDNIVV